MQSSACTALHCLFIVVTANEANMRLLAQSLVNSGACWMMLGVMIGTHRGAAIEARLAPQPVHVRRQLLCGDGHV